MRSRKPRNVVRPGDAWKELQRTAKIRKQQDDERHRHRSAVTDLSLRRQKAMLQPDPQKLEIELARINQKQLDEDHRHRAKMETLTTRILRKP